MSFQELDKKIRRQQRKAKQVKCIVVVLRIAVPVILYATAVYLLICMGRTN